jgi:ABC-type sugar transport system substrate-binding protein
MISKSKLAFVAAALAATFSVPAFAQAIDHTGTLQPSYYDVSGKQIMGNGAPSGPAAPNRLTVKPTAQARPLYNSAVTPIEFGGGVSGYDPSIASQR